MPGLVTYIGMSASLVSTVDVTHNCCGTHRVQSFCLLSVFSGYSSLAGKSKDYEVLPSMNTFCNARWQGQSRGGYLALLISSEPLCKIWRKSNFLFCEFPQKSWQNTRFSLTFILTIQAKIIWIGKEYFCLVSGLQNSQNVSKTKVEFCMLSLTQPNRPSPVSFWQAQKTTEGSKSCWCWHFTQEWFRESLKKVVLTTTTKSWLEIGTSCTVDLVLNLG